MMEDCLLNGKICGGKIIIYPVALFTVVLNTQPAINRHWAGKAFFYPTKSNPFTVLQPSKNGAYFAPIMALKTSRSLTYF
ncbi:hypothetical protein [Paracnuella aquatica]|uniref:hypothetical protein n=1 Tax=Paracnuella aquatica TaxID=2268757 RepID=UPI00138FA43A|nr:hypothetical protein [Paracnuella aquatica]